MGEPTVRPASREEGSWNVRELNPHMLVQESAVQAGHRLLQMDTSQSLRLS